MRLLVSKSANASSFYVQKDIKKGNSRTTVIVEKLGTETEIMEKYGVADAKAWALDYIANLNRIEKEKKTEIMPVNMKLFPQQEYLTEDIYHFNQFTTALDLIRFVKK